MVGEKSAFLRRDSYRRLLLSAGAVFLGVARGRADTIWQAGVDNWFTASNWSAGVPNDSLSNTTANAADIDNGGTAQIATLTASLFQLFLGSTAGESGSVALFSGELSSSDESIGVNGTGAFTQTGGTNSVANGLSVGSVDPGSSGSYNLQGGTLVANSIGVGGGIGGTPHGIFIQTGGNLTAQSITVNESEGGQATFLQTGGTLSFIGMSVGTGGVVSLTSMTLGQGGNGTSFDGTGTLSCPSITLNPFGGFSFTGTLACAMFNQTGSIVTMPAPGTPWSLFGYMPGPGGTYIQSGGTFSTTKTSSETIGYLGTGAFVQSGSTTDSPTGLVLGSNAGSFGSYTLAGSASLTAGSFGEAVGEQGLGVFSQTSGINTMADLAIGSGSPGSAGPPDTYYLSGGTLSVTSTDHGALIGYTSNGTLMQSGGTFTCGNLERVGFSYAGTYIQSGGTNTTPALYLGYNSGQLFPTQTTYGTSTYIQTGGTTTVTNVYIGANTFTSDPAGLGKYELDGGVLNVGTLQIGDGINIPGTLTPFPNSFTQTGGALSVTQQILLYAGSTMTISGSTATAGSVGMLFGSKLLMVWPIGADSPGNMNVTGNFGAGNELSFALGGPAAGTQYSVLNVGGTASLEGALEVDLANGFTPVQGQTFDILNAASISGTFSTVILPGGLATANPNGSFSNGAYLVTLTSTQVIVTALPEPAGIGVGLGTAALALRRRKRRI